ncbi:MAG: DUF2155 domain-containing protein [Alphaproteobacteria bacterium]|jgi:hypothetical protein|nr:DUF2155 domain-containing protein [Alphaproteobacteria bacterium]
MKAKAIKLAIFLILLSNSISNAMEMENYDTSVLGALNKITGKTETLEIEVGKETDFGDLKIKTLSCQKSSPLDLPESASFLKIYYKKDEIFSGWMFASSPSLSAMESGIYDIWVKDCKKTLVKEK